MHLSLDAPSNNSVGLCLTHVLLLKNNWLKELGLPENVLGSFSGTPEVIHADNANEFRGTFLRTVSKEYDIDLHLRPVAKPRYGAHIERLMGTVSTWLKEAPGATFSGPTEKGEYDSEGNACMTFDELECWLVTKFSRYHSADVHSGIGTTPEQKWREGILGTKSGRPRGLPIIRSNVDKVRFDFMPIIERTVQNDGVSIDNINYWDDVLRPWIGLKDPEHPSEVRPIPSGRDPRDISSLCSGSPRAEGIFELDPEHPPMSLWEWQKAQADASKDGVHKSDEHKVFQYVEQNRGMEEKAAEANKVARRAQERRSQHEKSRTKKIKTANSTLGGAPVQIPGMTPTRLPQFRKTSEIVLPVFPPPSWPAKQLPPFQTQGKGEAH